MSAAEKVFDFLHEPDEKDVWLHKIKGHLNNNLE